MQVPQDFVDLLAAFGAAQVRYLVIGGYAVGAHSVPRFTKDIDLLIAADADNLVRCASALLAFGAPSSVVDAMHNAERDDVIWMGNPPVRIDMLQWIPGVSFAEAWPRHIDADWGGVTVHVIGLDDLIRAKDAAGRPQDRQDAKALRKVRGD